MTDLELYTMRWVDFAHITSTPTAAAMIALSYDLSEDSVRSRLSRTDTPQNKALVARQLVKSHTSPSLEQLEKEVAANVATFERDKRIMLGGIWDDEEACAVFVSDLHLPYVRWDAFDLVLQILTDLKPDYISAMNDFNDNTNYGRWPDTRAPFTEMWDKDISNLRQTEKLIYTSMRKAAFDEQPPLMLGVNGNHDLWYRRALLDRLPTDALRIWTDYVVWLRESCGVLVLDAERENVVRLSPGLAWWHGQFIASNQTANAENTIKQLELDGEMTSVVVGHTHRPFQTKAFGRNFYNSGCLSRMDNVPYLKRDPKNWGLGIVVNYFIPGTRTERGEVVRFTEEGNKLVARLNGKEYRTNLVKD